MENALNYILLSNSKRKSDLLHLIGKSVLNGQFMYEILLDKVNREVPLIKQLHCRVKKKDILTIWDNEE